MMLRDRLVRLDRVVRRRVMTITPVQALDFTIVVLLTVQIAVLGLNTLDSQKPILGLRLEGNNIGQLLGGDTRNHIANIIDSHENKTLTVQAADYTGSVTLRQLGVQADKQKVYDDVLNAGRTGNLLKQFIDQNRASVGALDMQLPTPLDETAALAYLGSIDQKIDLAPVDAQFILENQKITVQSDMPGMAVEVDAALEQLRDANTNSRAPINLPVKQTHATVTAARLLPHVHDVQQIVQKPLVISANGHQITLSEQDLLALIVPKVVVDPSDSGKQTLQLTFDEAKLKARMDELLRHALVAPESTIMNGKKVIREGKSGVQPANDHSIVDVVSALVQRQNNLAMPETVEIALVTVDPPIVQQTAASTNTQTGTGLVRLTFDDGPGAHTEKILDILKQYNVHATFYVIGANAQRYPATMQRIKNEGHSIAGHSFTHGNLARMSKANVSKELSDTQAAILQSSGVKGMGFRPPYGAQNTTVREAASSLGLSIDMWSVDPRDWAKPGSQAITERVLASVGPGAVVLLHVLHQQTVDSLPAIIEGIRAQGYTLE